MKKVIQTTVRVCKLVEPFVPLLTDFLKNS